MNLIEEYRNQNTWRNWNNYLEKIPFNKEQIVYDLGCSIGYASNLIAPNVKEIIGIDNDKELLKVAMELSKENCRFIEENIFTINLDHFKKCDGIWTSFTIAYMAEPREFINKWTSIIKTGGWFAIVDIDNMFSGHLDKKSKYYNIVSNFEKESGNSKVYDFTVGNKIKNLMMDCGLDIIYSNESCYDDELNFNGSAGLDVLANWEARLERMVKLKEYLGEDYDNFTKEFIDNITSENHKSQGCVKYYIGIKRS